MNSERKESLLKCFEHIDESQRIVIDRMIDEVVYLEDQMTYLKGLPQIIINPKNEAMQKATEASKQYKVLSQSYMNAVRILLGVLKSQEETEQNQLLAKLAEFTA